MLPRKSKRRWSRFTVPGYVLVTVTLGFAALIVQFPGLPLENYAIRTFQLFSFSGVAEPDHAERTLNPGLLVARALAGIFTVVAGTQLLRRLLGEQWTVMRLRLTPPDVIICGLGEKGRHLANHLRQHRRRVAVIENATPAESAAAARDTGAIVLPGSGTESHVLERANLQDASALVVFTGSDRTNVEIALLGAALARRQRRKIPLRCAVHLTSSSTRTLLQQSELFPSGGACTVRFFNVDEMTARLLLTVELPAGQAGTLARQLVLVGFGHLGESLAVQYALVAHHPSGDKPRVTVIAPDARAAERRLLTRFPHFRDACDIHFVECDLGPGSVAALAEFSCANWQEPRDVVLAGTDDVSNLLLALELRRAFPGLDSPIYLRVRDARGLEGLVGAAADGGKPARLIPFGQLENVCSPENVLDERLDRLAQAVHESYCENAAARGETPVTNPSMVPWEELGEDLREASRRQADHHLIKLRSIGARIVPLAPGETAGGFTFSETELEALGRAEHKRWCAERQLGGWTYDPVRDNARRKHPSLVPWGQLDEANQRKDYDVVNGLPALLAMVGSKIERLDVPPTPPVQG